MCIVSFWLCFLLIHENLYRWAFTIDCISMCGRRTGDNKNSVGSRRELGYVGRGGILSRRELCRWLQNEGIGSYIQRVCIGTHSMASHIWNRAYRVKSSLLITDRVEQLRRLFYTEDLLRIFLKKIESILSYQKIVLLLFTFRYDHIHTNIFY